jgi:hypothetical protein
MQVASQHGWMSRESDRCTYNYSIMLVIPTDKKLSMTSNDEDEDDDDNIVRGLCWCACVFTPTFFC